jgi:hypothetical protein
LEYLRRLEGDRPKPKTAPVGPVEEKAAPKVEPKMEVPAPAPAPAPVARMTAPEPMAEDTPDQKAAIRYLRKLQSEGAAAPAASAAVTPTTEKPKEKAVRAASKPAAKNKNKTAAKPVPESAAQPEAQEAAVAAPERPAGPKTKHEKLMELLDTYRADKLTPAQYQEQRAKILSEP